VVRRWRRRCRSPWTAHGEALRAHFEAAAARNELTVPVVVHVDTDSDTFRTCGERGGRSEFVTLGDGLVEAAVLVTPLPDDGAEPLQRLAPPAELGVLEAR
jgi:hypothetical protein